MVIEGMMILLITCDIALECPGGHAAEMSGHCGANVFARSGTADDVLPLAKGVVFKVKGKLFTVNQGTTLGPLQLLMGEHGPGANIPIDPIGVFDKGFVGLSQLVFDQGFSGHVETVV
jgi:hypothetical protein